MTILVLIAMSVPSLFSLYIPDTRLIEELSLTSAGAMLILYVLFIIYISMIGIALMNELLVASVEAFTATLGLTPFLAGIIIVPIIGNVAEHLVAVQAARQNKMDLSLSISLGSSLQIALYVTPVLVFVSLLLNSPLTLEFICLN